MRVFCYFLIGEHLKMHGFLFKNELEYEDAFEMHRVLFKNELEHDDWTTRKRLMLLSRDLLENLCFSVSDLA